MVETANEIMASTTVEIPKVSFIGSGKMAQAMCKGFLASGIVKPSHITMSDPHGKQYPLLEPLGVCLTRSNVNAVKQSTVVFIAVKPHIVRPVLQEVYNSVTKDHIIVSIAGGITLETLEKDLPAGTRVVTAMPNTPCLVQCGVTVYTLGTHASQEDGKMLKCLLTSLGLVEEIPERLMAAVVGVSGSGPAYMYVAAEALADGGVKMGLPRDMSMRLAAQMMMGAAKMVLETGEHPGKLKDNVCSPGGTTICAIAALERLGFRSALINAVEASATKSLEIGAREKRKAEEESASVDETTKKRKTADN